MYDKRSKQDWLTAAIMAALGAGVVTSFAISRGQHPLIAIGITVLQQPPLCLLMNILNFSKNNLCLSQLGRSTWRSNAWMIQNIAI
ncbi:MAG: hypothetical protein HC769_00940 [Cyanobacteria bacterium CRU_2_1]|nr:hypothetical protein [Cyanobacteria bacterium CRU_2_1]